MWWSEYLLSGFDYGGPIAGILIFRTLFALCCLVKFTTETLRGYYNYFEYGTYLHAAYHARPHLFVIPSWLYRIVYILKIAAALALFSGVFPRLGGLVLLISFLLEIQIYFKFHTNLFLLVTAALLLSPNLSDGFTLVDFFKKGFPAFLIAGVNAEGDVFPQILIMLTMSFVYLATAYRKMNKVFVSGAVVYLTLQQTLKEQYKRRYFDAFFPSKFVTMLVNQPEHILRRRWQPFMITTILLEIVVALGLWTAQFRVAAIAFGVLMHLGFTWIAPATLLHFSVLSISTYILFIDPKVLVAVLWKTLF